MYRIEMITHKTKDREERTDGRYPLRKGCLVNIGCLCIGDALILLYIKDADGNEKSGGLVTSTVEEIAEYSDCYTVFTSNSVYYLKKVTEEMEICQK